MTSWRHVQSHQMMDVAEKNQMHQKSDNRGGPDATVLAVINGPTRFKRSRMSNQHLQIKNLI